MILNIHPKVEIICSYCIINNIGFLEMSPSLPLFIFLKKYILNLIKYEFVVAVMAWIKPCDSLSGARIVSEITVFLG